MRYARNAVIALAALVACTTAATAQEGRVIGKFDDWVAQTFRENGNTGCAMWSQPTKSEGDYTRRGDVYAYVTHRPWAKRLNEVSIAIGYPFRPESEAEVRIDSQQPVPLFTDGDTAWNRTPQDDTAMVRAMRAGGTMLVKGTSSRGTLTSDTFSLRGFTAAHRAIGEACKVQ